MTDAGRDQTRPEAAPEPDRAHPREPLPSQQHAYEGLPSLPEARLHGRRETVFLLLAGVFLGCLAMLNILGISRFIVFASVTDGVWSFGRWAGDGGLSFAVAVGVLPYPLTFLCTDLISELYGRARANRVVWIGLLINGLVLATLWIGGALPVQIDEVSYGIDTLGREVTAPPIPEPVFNGDGEFVRFNDDWTYGRIQMLTQGAIVASMIAYLAAQLVDVHVFHFWKWLTKGKHLWLRNNGSTLLSQFIDTFAVITITYFYARNLNIDPSSPVWPQLWVYIGTGYAFKVAAALLDTGPFYLATHGLERYLRLPPRA